MALRRLDRLQAQGPVCPGIKPGRAGLPQDAHNQIERDRNWLVVPRRGAEVRMQNSIDHISIDSRVYGLDHTNAARIAFFIHIEGYDNLGLAPEIQSESVGRNTNAGVV